MTCTVDNFGAQHWRNSQGQFHRTDGPAVIYLDNTRFWYINGQHHRIDGPAKMYWDGMQHWYVNDQDITNEVKAWMETQDVTWPWDSSTQTLFTLTFGV